MQFLQGHAIFPGSQPTPGSQHLQPKHRGEWLYGAGRGTKNLVYVILGTGYGCSVILDGMPLRGRRGMAGVRGGHIAVNAGPGCNECVCGGAGCAESEIGSLTKNAEKYPGYSESSLYI